MRAANNGRFEAVVFDCDGLLLDTEGAWEKGEAELLARYGHRYTKKERRRFLGVSAAEAGRVCADILGTPEREAELLRELHEICYGIVPEEARPMPGAESLVRELYGRLPLGVASNSPTDLLHEVLGRAGLLDLFDVVLGDADVKRPKPAPDPYLLACERLGASPGRSVALEDSPTGAAAARAAGTFVVGVPSESGVSFEADLLVPSLRDPALERLLFPG